MEYVIYHFEPTEYLGRFIFTYNVQLVTIMFCIRYLTRYGTLFVLDSVNKCIFSLMRFYVIHVLLVKLTPDNGIQEGAGKQCSAAVLK